MTGRHSVGIAGQMEIDLFHGKNLRPPSTCPSAFDPKYRPQRRLPKRDSRSMAEARKAHGKPDGRGGFTFSKRGRIDGGHKDILAEGCGMKPLKCLKRHFRFQLSVRK